MFRFAVMTTEGEELGAYAFVSREFAPGDLIPASRDGGNLEVLTVVPSDGEDRLPLLVVRRQVAVPEVVGRDGAARPPEAALSHLRAPTQAQRRPPPGRRQD